MLQPTDQLFKSHAQQPNFSWHNDATRMLGNVEGSPSFLPGDLTGDTICTMLLHYCNSLVPLTFVVSLGSYVLWVGMGYYTVCTAKRDNEC